MINLVNRISVVNTIIKNSGRPLVFRFNSQYCIRSHLCEEIGSAATENHQVTLAGWVQACRMDKFILLRDISGLCQVNFDHIDPSIKDLLLNLPNESVMVLNGEVKRRPEGQINNKMKTGEWEVHLSEVVDCNPAASTLPVQLSKHVESKEPLRLQYRYLDLRRKELQENLMLRSMITMKIREFLVGRGFLDIETPTLFKRTPGGAKEFIVPTRTKDKFYSLVQSPQQFKQLLMVGGLDRYFQVARCYRDEGGRPDRQPEFTQIDLEMSFASREDIISLVEGLVSHIWPSLISSPFETITYKEAIAKFGIDKPDLRYGNEIIELTEDFINSGFHFLDQFSRRENLFIGAITFNGNDIKALKLVENELKNSFRDQVASAKEKQYPLIITSISHLNGDLSNSLLKKCNLKTVRKVGEKIVPGEVGMLVLGDREEVLPVLGKARNLLAESYVPDLGSLPDKFLWVLDFPLFLYEDGELQSAHHPFTACHPQDRDSFRSDPLSCRSLHYDLVLNGQEIAGGSVRIHSQEEQRHVLGVLGEASGQLEHLLQALGSGCPPHAGIAFGLDRLVTILARAKSIRDVIAFPKSSDGKDLMSGAPAEIDEAQYSLYHLKK